ncbi:MAG: hypothetical protein CMJ27_14380 [Phycisphaerae bacterium]|nr:hypothetical protein [Phycisphaerae bacterium]OUW99710.1 MAG: hypothetical protein CBD91_08345 [Phycisphaeraceae bacterium TMED231]
MDLLGVDPDDDPDFMRAGGSSLLLMEFQLRLYQQRWILLDLDSLEYPINFDAMVSLAREASGESSDEAPEKPDSPTVLIEVVESHCPDIGDPLGLDPESGVSSEMPRSLTAPVRESARIHPDAIAVHEGDEVICHAEPVEAEDGLEPAFIRRELADRLPSWLVPQHLRIVDSIPLSGNGKIDRVAASNRFQSDAAPIQSSS